MESDPTIQLRNPNGETIDIPYGLTVHIDKWKDYLVVAWVHQHRLLGLVSEDSLKAARENKPFHMHKVCTWISQVAIAPNPQGKLQIQSIRAIVKYDNAEELSDLRVTSNSAVLRVCEQDKGMSEWLLTEYRKQVLPSDIQLATKLPSGPTSH